MYVCRPGSRTRSRTQTRPQTREFLLSCLANSSLFILIKYLTSSPHLWHIIFVAVSSYGYLQVGHNYRRNTVCRPDYFRYRTLLAQRKGRDYYAKSVPSDSPARKGANAQHIHGWFKY
eukprot:scaffold153277_cov26-Attheya_sp.AAC.1